MNNQILLHRVLLFFIALVSYTAEAKSSDIIVWNRLSDNPVSYRILQLALDKTVDSYGPYNLKPSIEMEQGRVHTELKRNLRVHIASFAPSQKREDELLPIRIPVTRGLLGLRVCLIHEDNQQRFTGIDNAQQWIEKAITIGQGQDWPDTAILEANQFNVVKSAKYLPLFDMLAKKRFDCFSRSVSEVIPELNKYTDKGIILEQNYLLAYRLPTFFFLSRRNQKLAERISLGLTLANKDGSFNKTITNAYRDQFNKINIRNRKIIYLDNPFLSIETRRTLKDESLWFNPLMTEQPAL
ncbi:MAG: hypothetical protein OEY36_10725 [Gammaproteobacteria bacterium]|nr:hypothetical protein [Gammaproteobacteria bacterium]